MRITLLVDNLPGRGLRSEHGISLLVETDAGSVLFDTGQSDAWQHNLRVLGKNPGAIQAVALSHGHYDHTGGLAAAAALLPGVTVFAHPDCLRPRFANDGLRRRGIGMPQADKNSETSFTFNERPETIMPGVTLSGVIPLRIETNDPAANRFLIQTDHLEPDRFVDEQCLILQEGERVGVLLGCSHRGVENNLLAALELAGSSHVDLAIGGMHLGSADDARLKALAGFLQEHDIRHIVCCHCTGDRAYRYLSARLGERVTQGHTGSWWQL
ncbi:MAG: MBL fold metallo-hydrolase [candidate division WS1 bacterium]|nr:MBL fold metallo-hydrolase [candidate division WS1 bacterium]